MKIFFQNIKDESGKWLGDEITVSTSTLKIPKLHLEVCGRGFFKLKHENSTLFWARLHACYQGVAILKTFKFSSLLSPIHSEEVERKKGLNKEELLKAWSQHFIEDLKSKENLLFYDGTWVMTANVSKKNDWCYEQLNKNEMGHAHVYGFEKSLNENPFQQIDWFMGDSEEVVNLRKVNAYDGRLKWWRKKAKEGSLPPILLLFISGLDNYIILDGHYRLKAAYLENVVPDILILRASEKTENLFDNEKIKASIEKQLEVHKRKKHLSKEHVNDLLIKAHTNSWTWYNSRNKVYQKNNSACIKEVATYLNELGKLDLMQEFFDGEWNHI